MKKLPLLFLLIVTISCQNDDSMDRKKGLIQFSFSGNPGGKVGETAEPAAILMSLEDADGNVIEQDKKLPLYAFGSGYVSEGLQLPTGNYKLTKFMVLDAENTVIYATPVEGSDLAYLVDDPLPIAFAVAESGTTLVAPQVLAVTESNAPENFGYVSFGIEVMSQNSRLARVIFQEYQGYIDTVTFQYDAAGRMDKATWKVYNNHPYFPQTLLSDYSEKRSYSANGELISLKGDNIWDLNYGYTNGFRNTVIAKRDIGWVGELKYYSTTTYQEYSGIHPVQLKIESYIGFTRNIEIEYNPDWNIGKMKVYNGLEPEFETTIQYGSELNPLQNLFETNLFGLYGYHEDCVFYYAKNLPISITRDRFFSQTSYIEKTVFQYTYSKDNEGKITGIAVRAKITDNNQQVWYNDKAYDIQLQYQ